MKLIRTLIQLLLFSLFLACSHIEEEKQYTIGFAQCFSDNNWRQKMNLDMQIELIDHPNLKLVIKDANEDPELQADQIREFINNDVDLLIISPVQSYPITPIAEEAYKLGIPTIILNRRINSNKYTTYIGTDNYEIGRNAALYATSKLDKKEHTILEIQGNKASSPAIDRHIGFYDVIKNIPNINLLSIDGSWNVDSTKNQLLRIEDFEKIDVLYAHNDEMAQAAREALLKINPSLVDKIIFIGVDALPGKGLGIEAVASEKLQASFMYPTGGDIAIQLASRILKGEPVGHSNLLTSTILEKENADILYIQSNKLTDFQEQIENQQILLQSLYKKNFFFRNSLVVFIILGSILAIAFVYIFIMSFRLLKKNNELKRAYLQVARQKEALTKANQEIQEVTAQKMQFFTNISHEVKTPLTLISGPVKKILQYNSKNSEWNDDLKIVYKNVLRLERVIEQLLDFRKIESARMPLRVCQFDLLKTIQNTMGYFENEATEKKIDFKFEHDTDQTLLFWGDEDKIDKIMMNLLSNAFKFTPKNGKILIKLTHESKSVQILVEDNGTGILPNHISEIFEKFFTENQSYTPGTGIGLHLTREFVMMHKGNIQVKSEPNVSTVFTITMPNDKSIYENYITHTPTISDNISNVSVSGQDKTFLIPDKEINDIVSKSYRFNVMIVEDDPDISSYIKKELSNNFNIFTANNGIDALDMLKQNDISIVVSDVLMPKMNGFELCKRIKSDMAYSYIPVILLTALNDSNQQLYGLIEGADDYIKKPFDLNYLKLRIIKLVEERKRLKESYNSIDLPNSINEILKKTENADNQFMKKFIALIENNYQDSEFNIEKGSEALGVSRVHLYRKVKEQFNVTPIDFLKNYRLKQATALLQENKLSISEIAYTTGFSSPAYFSKCFKSLYDTTPSEFIEQIKSK